MLAGWTNEYRLAVERASLSLLKSLAVLALAMAIERLPGQASGSLRTPSKNALPINDGRPHPVWLEQASIPV